MQLYRKLLPLVLATSIATGTAQQWEDAKIRGVRLVFPHSVVYVDRDNGKDVVYQDFNFNGHGLDMIQKTYKEKEEKRAKVTIAKDVDANHPAVKDSILVYAKKIKSVDRNSKKFRRFQKQYEGWEVLYSSFPKQLE